MNNNSKLLLKKEMRQYEKRMLEYLPIERKVNQLKKQGFSLDEIKYAIGPKINVLYDVPDVLYHGSKENFDVIEAKESTQQGKCVYATDNPIHALFFAIFRNSSVIRSNIKESVLANNTYQVKYVIDERIKGAIASVINDTNVVIYICDGNKFFKPSGASYISREWCSKNGENIIPINKININVKQFFESLEKNHLVEYIRYNKKKDWKTVIDFLGQNYAFGLTTEKGKDIQKYDHIIDEFIKTNFPKQFEFYVYFRNDIKRIMMSNFNSGNTNSNKDKINQKLQIIKELADSFLVKTKTENDKVILVENISKIDEYISKHKIENNVSDFKWE